MKKNRKNGANNFMFQKCENDHISKMSCVLVPIAGTQSLKNDTQENRFQKTTFVNPLGRWREETNNEKYAFLRRDPENDHFLFRVGKNEKLQIKAKKRKDFSFFN